MKNLLLFAAAACSLTFVACGDDDDGAQADCPNDTGYTIAGNQTCATGEYELDDDGAATLFLTGADSSTIDIDFDSLASGTYTVTVDQSNPFAGFGPFSIDIEDSDGTDIQVLSGSVSLEVEDELLGGTFEFRGGSVANPSGTSVTGAFSQIAEAN